MDGSRTGRTGARAVVEQLLAEGVTTAFGVPGESYLGVLDALHDAAARIRLIPNRHEGGAAFMAEAWARLTGEVGVCLVTRGPGATNAAIGVHAAMQAATPLVLFVGQVDTAMRGRDAFQEIDYRAVFGGLAKWAVEIDRADRAPELVSRAFSVARSGRPGPVVVALPEDMLAAPTDAAVRPAAPVPRPAPDEGALEAIRAALAEAERPMLLVGGGGWTEAGRAALRAFAEGASLPVVADFRRQDVIDHDSRVYVGDAGLGKAPALRAALSDADVLLALGSDLGEITTDGYTLIAGQRLIHVHPDVRELNKVHRADLPVAADAEATAIALAGAPLGARAGWFARTAGLRGEHLAFLETPAQPGGVDMGAVMRVLQAALPDDAILTNGAGNFAIWPNKHFRFRARQRLIAPPSGAMGFGLPAAIAAKIAFPDRLAVAFVGDGDVQMTLAELGCAAQTGAAPIVLVVDNGGYGTIRMHQETHFPGRVSFTELRNPDFAAIARAYGMTGERVTATEDFAAAFARARAAPAGALIVLAVDMEAITPRRTLSQIRDAAQGG